MDTSQHPSGRPPWLRLAFPLLLLIGTAVLVTIHEPDTRTQWISCAAILIVSFVWCWVELLRWSKKRKAIVPLVLFFSCFFATHTEAAPAQLLSAPNRISDRVRETLPPILGDDSGLRLVGHIDRDGNIVDERGNQMYDDSGNKLIVMKNGGQSVIMAQTYGGTITRPNIGLCEAIAGMIIIGVGVYVGYKLYKCAKKALYPTNAPPTNGPPNDNDPSPPGQKSMRRLTLKANATLTTTTMAQFDTSSIEPMDCSDQGWTDWQGNPYVTYVTGTVTNYSTATSTNGFKSSTDLVNWKATYISFQTWTSENPPGFPTNSLTITYDESGVPFATNWCSVDYTGTNIVPIGYVSGVPIDAGVPKQFYWNNAPVSP